ncbi:MAG: Ohr family peroxiredoxin, partial [Chthoniobacterales bacterium]
MKILYTTEVTSTGGRDGTSKSSDGVLDVKLNTVKELGGAGGPGTNPEQLYGAGHSACFLGALKFVAGQAKIHIPNDATVTAKVGIRPMISICAVDVSTPQARRCNIASRMFQLLLGISSSRA